MTGWGSTAGSARSLPCAWPLRWMGSVMPVTLWIQPWSFLRATRPSMQISLKGSPLGSTTVNVSARGRSPGSYVGQRERRYTHDMPVDSQIQERRGEAFELDAHLTVIGRKLRPGDSAPPFELECFDANLCAIKIVRLADSDGQVRLINVVNSLDTPVFDVETQKWEERRAQLPADVQLMTISMDLPFAPAGWCEAAGVGHQALSAHRNEQFGRDYGVLIKEWRLLQRAVFVLDRAGRVAYADYVPDQMAEPDYAVALAAVRDIS